MSQRSGGSALERWYERGFDVIPIEPRGKVPAMADNAGKKWRPLKEWGTIALLPEERARLGKLGANVGVRTKNFPAIDVDVDDQEVADAIEVVIHEKLGTAPVRVRENSPRRAMLYRLDGASFKKKILKFNLPSGAEAKVEVLVDGQQIVVAGTHPSGAKLAWRDKEPKADDLPKLDATKLTGLLKSIQKALEGLGCTGMKPLGAAPSAKPAASGEIEDCDKPLYFDPVRVRHALDNGGFDPDEHDVWISVGQALHAADPNPAGPGLATWDEWSATSERYEDGACAARWATFRRDRGRTLAGLFVLAKRGGWTPPTVDETRESIISRLKAMTDEQVREHYARLASANDLTPAQAAPIEEYAKTRLSISDDEVKGDRADAVTATDLQLNAARTALGAALEHMNEKHFILRTGGDVGVGMIEDDTETKRRKLTCQREADFLRWYRTNRIETQRGDVPLATAWLNWPQRRQYRGITLEPDADAVPEGVLNLWQGFSVEPQEGDWSLIRDHIYNVWCKRDETLFQYVIGWLARSVQQPGLQGEVALVLRGEEGAGKGVIVRMWLRLLASHSMHVTSPKALVGDFNAHLNQIMFLFADEALFAGDPTIEGKLKGLITEPTLTVEPKGVDRYEVRNRLKIIMATNNDWAVPAGPRARRFCVMDISDERLEDFDYFGQLDDASKDPEVLGAMLHDLLAWDLSQFNVRKIPHTQALEDQKNFTLRGVAAFLRDLLSSGRLDIDANASRLLNPWENTDDLHRAYELWARKHNQRLVPHNSFGHEVKKYFERKRESNVTAQARAVKGQAVRRGWGYGFGPLDKARKQFADTIKIPGMFKEE